MAAVSTRVALVAIAAVATGCGGSHTRDGAAHLRLRTPFMSTGQRLAAECRSGARAVGYAVPCPTRIPRGLAGTATGIPTATGVDAQPGCRPRFQIVGVPPCRPLRKWKGWIAGSSQIAWPREHLVILASPRPIRDYAKFVNGPAWYPADRVDAGDWTTVNGRRVRWVFVPPGTNDGSAVAGHVMLIWTTGGHTYGVGFHDTSTRAATRAMDVELVRHLRMVEP